MSNYRVTETSETYIEALRAVEGIDPPAAGFTKTDSLIPVAISKIIKQNNLIIQILVKIAEEVQNSKEELGELKRGVNTLLGQKQNADTLEDVVKKLENWKPGETSKPLVDKKPGPFYVFEDPKKIYQREWDKAHKK